MSTDNLWSYLQESSVILVTQIRGRKAGFSFVPIITILALLFYRGHASALSSLVCSHRIAPTHATITGAHR